MPKFGHLYSYLIDFLLFRSFVVNALFIQVLMNMDIPRRSNRGFVNRVMQVSALIIQLYFVAAYILAMHVLCVIHQKSMVSFLLHYKRNNLHFQKD